VIRTSNYTRKGQIAAQFCHTRACSRLYHPLTELPSLPVPPLQLRLRSRPSEHPCCDHSRPSRLRTWSRRFPSLVKPANRRFLTLIYQRFSTAAGSSEHLIFFPCTNVPPHKHQTHTKKQTESELPKKSSTFQLNTRDSRTATHRAESYGEHCS